jgi:7-dehydrocholesterol reductase
MGPSGVTAVYPANGFAAMFGTAGFYAGMHYLGYLDFFQFVKDQFAHHGEVTCALNVIGFAATILLYLRGVFMPYDGEGGKGDAKLDGPLRDMYWGVELHPLILGTRVKLLCCRVGMMYWTLMCVTAPIYSALNSPDGTPSNAVLASCAIQMVYNVKFFLWEDGYINSMDMAVDKAGFMICWGCLAYVPSVYTLVCYYLAKLAPSDDIVTVPVAVAMFALGIALTLLNYWVDVQRTRFRDTDGKGLIWGAKPVVLRAPYVTEDGKTRMSCLLCSGWWGVARDIRYTFEMGATLAWTIPALFTHFVPYYYAAFLTILLIHRGERHERRCAKKYGDVWKKYSEIVPGRWFPTAKSFAPKRVD